MTTTATATAKTHTVVNFRMERETKGTFVFQELNDENQIRPKFGDPNAVIGTLYIRKHVFDGKIPTNVTITIDSE